MASRPQRNHGSGVRPHLLFPLLVLWIGIGCAHYQVGTPEDARPGAVAVSTVAAPASWGVATDQLTRQLVDELDRRLATSVRWTADGNSGVDCTLDDLTQNGYVDGHAAEVVARCRVTGRAGDGDVVRTRGRGLNASPGRAADGAAHLNAGATSARRVAAHRALERAARQIAHRLADESWANDSTKPDSSSAE